MGCGHGEVPWCGTGSGDSPEQKDASGAGANLHLSLGAAEHTRASRNLFHLEKEREKVLCGGK